MMRRVMGILQICSVLLLLASCGQQVKAPAKNRTKKAASGKRTSEQKFEEELAVLMKKHKDVNTIKDRDIPMLIWAVEHGYLNAVKTLLEKGADPNTKPKARSHDTALFLTAKSHSFAKDKFDQEKVRKSREIAKLLIKHGAKVNYTTPFGDTPLHQAALRGRADLCELFIRKGAKVNASDKLGRMPLHQAAKEGYWEAVEVLLGNGAKVKAVTKLKETPLSLAKQKKEEELNQQIRKGARSDWNTGSDYERTVDVLKRHGARR